MHPRRRGTKGEEGRAKIEESREWRAEKKAKGDHIRSEE